MPQAFRAGHPYPGGVSADTMARMIEDLKQQALRRLRIIAGQVAGLERMVEDEAYCVELLTQSRAIQRSLRAVDRILIENHLRTHVSHGIAEGGEASDKAIAELLKLYELGDR